MHDSYGFSKRADQYVRGELDASSLTQFEAELLESPQLQDEVELALGLQQLLRLEQKQSVAKLVVSNRQIKSTDHIDVQWYRWGLAATVALTVVTSTLFWQAESESLQLQNLVALLNQPMGNVLTVPVDIMRSAQSETPDVIIRKPMQDSVMILDIELQPDMAQSSSVKVMLSLSSGEPMHALDAIPTSNGRVQVALSTAAISSGRYRLSLHGDTTNQVDQRLLELLPSAP